METTQFRIRAIEKTITKLTNGQHCTLNEKRSQTAMKVDRKETPKKIIHPADQSQGQRKHLGRASAIRTIRQLDGPSSTDQAGWHPPSGRFTPMRAILAITSTTGKNAITSTTTANLIFHRVSYSIIPQRKRRF